jgi:pyruvate/2-oxoacid:ferredoxin oxidoreductase alpha subunit
MCDEHILNLQEIQQSLATRMQAVTLQGVEQLLPSPKENLVSVYAYVCRNSVIDQQLND